MDSSPICLCCHPFTHLFPGTSWLTLQTVHPSREQLFLPSILDCVAVCFEDLFAAVAFVAVQSFARSCLH